MNWHWHGFGYDFDKQWRRFRGDGGGPGTWIMRALVFAFACWTMSAAPTQDHFIGPGIWLLLVSIWYFYPGD